MWDRHLLQLLYLKQEEERGSGSALATSSLPDPEINPRWKGAHQGSLNSMGQRCQLKREGSGLGLSYG